MPLSTESGFSWNKCSKMLQGVRAPIEIHPPMLSPQVPLLTFQDVYDIKHILYAWEILILKMGRKKYDEKI